MPMYCVDKHDRPDNSGHRVHDQESDQGCVPASYFQLPLGWHSDGEDALKEALEFYKDAMLCSCCKVRVQTG